jgi:hypothetical protein
LPWFENVGKRVVKVPKIYGFQSKFADTPTTTKSMRVALTDLKLETLFVVYAGNRNFPLDTKIEAVSLAKLADRIVDL